MFFCIISALLIYLHEKQMLEEFAYEKTQLVMTAVEANRAYVREVLRPRMFESFGADFFMVEAMSTSYVSRAVMDLFRGSMPDFDYRRVSVNARNPDSEANAMEREMIEYFRNHGESDNWQGLLKIDGVAHYRRFMPVYFDDSCMHCHGVPEDAPKTLLDIYGDQRGFGHYSGELAGVIAVGIPVDSALAMINEKATSVFLVVFMGVSIFYIALSFFFNRVVVHNVHGVLDIFRKELDEADEAIEPQPSLARDEITELTSSAMVLARRLHRTREELRDYAQTLEAQVAQRTEALMKSKQLLQAKVIARNQELRTLNTIAELTTQATELSRMLPSALRETLELVPAVGAGIFLHEPDREELVLLSRENADCLPGQISLVRPKIDRGASDEGLPGGDDVRGELMHSIVSAFEGRLQRYSRDNRGLMHIPLDCRGSVLGVMTLTGMDIKNLSSEQEDLLISIGRQIGIAVESLNNLHKLMQSKELLQSVFDGITDPVVLLDRDHRIRMVNKAFLQQRKASLEKVSRSACHELLHGTEAPCEDCGMKDVLETRRPMSREMMCSPGEIFLVHYYPLFDDRGNVEGVIRYARDITQQKRVEQRIQQTEKLVAMGQLAAGVAHEINNPLGVIFCYVNLLKRQLEAYPQGHKDLEIIERQAQNCKRIVTDLLQFARSRESAKAPAFLNASLSEVAQMLDHQFKGRRISLEMDLDEDLPKCPADADKIKQVFVNLLMNALQAVDKGGTIRISSRFLETLQQAEIIFQDNGHGIPLEIQDKIFDPFFSTKHTGEGTGLGLSVSYGIVQEHGGEISLASEPGNGARFTIRLPVDKRLTG